MQKEYMTRLPENPLLTVKDVIPSKEGFRVEGIFNCGVTKYQGETILLCRIAEAVETENKNLVSFPTIAQSKDGGTEFQVISLEKDKHPELCFEDPRAITKGRDGYSNVVYLTSLSHLRIARSMDGIHFELDTKPTIMPNAEEECWGMEDPRITCLDGVYYINYTAVSPNGAATALITTKDFVTYERHGIIFLPENKDVSIFPEKVQGKYLALNRPVPKAIGNPDIWLSESEDLIHWGKHVHFYGVSENDWEDGRVGGGCPPFKTEKGWVAIYHAADSSHKYYLGAFLLDLDHPKKIIAKSKAPLLSPQEDYEVNGFFGNVVFSCGCIYEENTVKIFYGAADDKICRADLSIEELYHHLGVER